ncbi:MAG: CbbQ/NirQ/NorQ C-terminal domain-containing protein [Nitrososphaerota archaeon]|nr:CbbQ/NirQ/NorQ C-terminal domain-containing protein [Nitrososphaerota archaeon]
MIEETSGPAVGQAGWEVVRPKRSRLLVLTFDQASGKIRWGEPAALARTRHRGELVKVTTTSGQSITATKDHSFVTFGGTVKAADLKEGVLIPVVGAAPSPFVEVATGGAISSGAGGSPAKWERIAGLETVAYSGWVYDFEVPGTQTFVAGDGGVVTHNTHITYLVSELAGLPLWEINCGLQTSVYDLFGRFVGLGKENWIDGQIVSWCRYGGILYLDEANMMKQDIATRLNPILDTRGHMVLNERDNEVIPRHPNGYVIISMNPYSAEFAGTKPLNAAFRRRMTVWIDFDYLSVGSKIAQDEVEMIAQRAKIDNPVAEKLVRVAAEIRRQYKSGDLPYAPSVGDLVNWGTLVADGLTPASAAEETIIALTADDPEVQNNVRRVVKMVVGDK